MAQQATLADAVDTERLVSSFLELAKLNGPSGSEKQVADFLVGRLGEMGFSVQFDEAHEAIGGDCGNLIAWWDGTDSSIPPLYFSTHMDTVLPTDDLKPVIKDGVISSDGTTILGADDRAALAAYLEGIRVIQESGERCGPIELILTVAEQTALLGARHLDFAKVRSESGYIFDSSGDVGQIILKGPYGSLIKWKIEGKMSHLGLAPDEGISAILIAAEGLSHMKLGRIDDQTVASVGVIHGGHLASVIPDEVEMIGEVRSFTQAGLEAQIDHMLGAVEQAASRRGGKAHADVEKKYLGWELSRDSDHVRLAVRAAERIGIEPYFTETLGGADTNIFNEHGLTCFTFGLGFRAIHSFDEHISIENLTNTARYVVGLIEEFAETYGA